MTLCMMCLREIPDLPEGLSQCTHCGAVAFVENYWTERARQAYRDPAFEPRDCYKCGRVYRGPAVYCSLECAMEDAA